LPKGAKGDFVPSSDGESRHNSLAMNPPFPTLWERHLAAKNPWLEAAPTRAILHHSPGGAERHGMLLRLFCLSGFLI